MITDQFIVGCEVDRTRLHLIEKGPRTSREALSVGIAHHAAMRYNESLKDTSTVSAVEYRTPATHTTEQERSFYRGRGNSSYANRRQNQGNRWNNNFNRMNTYGSPNYSHNYNQQYRQSAPNTQFQNGASLFRSRGNNWRRGGRGIGRGHGRDPNRDPGRGPGHNQWFNGGRGGIMEEQIAQQTFSTNVINSPSCPYYVNAIFGKVEIPILLIQAQLSRLLMKKFGRW